MTKIFPIKPEKPLWLQWRLIVRIQQLAARFDDLRQRLAGHVAANARQLVERSSQNLSHHKLRVQILLFRMKQRGTSWGWRAVHHAGQWASTIIAAAVAIPFLLFVGGADLKPSEVHLTAAQVIGAALALVLALSIIPAQRAAEAFSPAILRLYARDRSLLGVFLLLVVTTTLSILLGANCGVAPSAETSPRLLFPSNFSPDMHIWNAHRVTEGDLYACRDVLEALGAMENGIDNVVSFLAPITAQSLEMLSSLMDEKKIEHLELF